MGVTLEPVTAETKAVLWRLLQLYLHDMSEFEGSLPDEAGEYRYDYFEHYFDPALMPLERRWAYFIRVEGALAGFALLRHMMNGRFQIAEFCILRAKRRAGLGLEAARAVLRTQPGDWDLTVHPRNLGAQAFWRRVIEANGAGEWNEKSGPLMVWHRFTVPGPSASTPA